MGVVMGLVAGAVAVMVPVATVGVTALMVHKFRRRGFKVRLGE